jgi:hypothetical protein
MMTFSATDALFANLLNGNFLLLVYLDFQGSFYVGLSEANPMINTNRRGGTVA